MKRALLNIAPVMVLAPLFAKASVPMSIMPGWDSDPMLTSDPGAMGTLGPGGSVVLDLCVLAGSVMWSAAMRMDGGSKHTRAWWLATIGRLSSIGVLLLIVPAVLGAAVGWTEQDWRIGMSWLSAIVAMVTVASASRDDPHTRGLAGALTLGFMSLLAVRAGLQFLVEHPQTVADFHATKEQFLLSRGWSDDSTSARAYERRLMQPDASAWFALSNVLASFAAAATVVLTGLAWALSRRAFDQRGLSAGLAAAIVLGLSTSVAALWFAHSKGGVIALGTGLLALAVMLIAMSARCRSWRLPAVLTVGIGAVVGPIGLVIGRGLLGERLGELSLLFRWFYMQGAAGVFAKYPLTGIGPDGFQQAFLLTKPMLCPEDPASAHSVLFDWVACLGVAGLVLGFGLIVLSVLIAASPLRAMHDKASRSQSSAATELSPRLVLLIPALSTILAAWIETPGMSPTSALARVVGLAGWCVIAGLSWRPLSARFASSNSHMRGGVFAAFAAGALTLIAHGQIEVTLSWTSSVGLAGVMLGVAWWRAAPCHRKSESRVTGLWPQIRAGAWAVALVFALTRFTVPGVVTCVQSDLDARAASNLLAPLGLANSRLADLRQRTLRGEAPPADIRVELEEVVRNLRKSYDPKQAPTCAGLEDPVQQELARATIALGTAAANRLDQTGDQRDWRFDRALAEVHIRVATAAADAGEHEIASRHMNDAIDRPFAHRLSVKNDAAFLDRARHARSGMNVPLLRTKSLVLLARVDLLEQTLAWTANEHERRRVLSLVAKDLLEALRCLKHAHDLDPNSPDHPARIAELAAAIVDRFRPETMDRADPPLTLPSASEPADWARLALRLNENARLDPVGRALAEPRVERLQQIVND